jgi:Calcium-dependent channel, 7TM region, putative phosphate
MKSTRAIATTGLTDEKLEEATRRFVHDDPGEMTYSRRFALWWNGIEGESTEGGPSLAKAWAFYDHVTLQRYIVEEPTREVTRQKSNIFRMGDRSLKIAEPGEAAYKTKLYPIFSTPLSQLGDFGLGFGIYFATLRDFAILALLCGLLSIPNIIFFASDQYSGDQAGIPTLLKGSAICTDRSWVPCPNCTPEEFDTAVKGAYDVKRFGLTWAVIPDENGYYWNITNYLEWDMVNETLARTPEGAVDLNQLINHSVPIQEGIEFYGNDGYILNGMNVTEILGYTPLWCGYRTATDCYLDLYPFFDDKDYQDHFTFVDQSFSAPLEYPADSRFIQLGFALKNNCDGAKIDQGYINWGTLLLMIVGSFLIRYRTRQIEIRFDEDEQTAQDYSIVVKNPPPDAWDPNEWKHFFENMLQQDAGGTASPDNEVRVCTVDVDNQFVIDSLVQRREALRRLEMALPAGTPRDMASLEQQAQREKEEPAGWFGAPTKIQKLVETVKDTENGLRKYFKKAKRPTTTRVYLTFETEAAQRKILSKMTVGTIQAENNSVNIPKHYKFRGKYILEVREAHEPSTIRWRDQDASRMEVGIRKLLTTIATVTLMLISYFTIRAIYRKNLPWLASIVTTIFTSLFPMVATWLMDCEKHHTESIRQAWLFLKVTMFNIFVTTVLLSLITPFEATLDKREKSLPGLLPTVHSLFFSQLGLTPALQLLDIGGNLQRHIMAPRAKTQAEMNLAMRGTPVHLAVRYANLMKFLYMTIWYCSIYPGTYFLGAFALLITYFVDRFSLMRSWARSPHGECTRIFQRSRKDSLEGSSNTIFAYFMNASRSGDLLLCEKILYSSRNLPHVGHVGLLLVWFSICKFRQASWKSQYF